MRRIARHAAILGALLLAISTSAIAQQQYAPLKRPAAAPLTGATATIPTGSTSTSSFR